MRRLADLATKPLGYFGLVPDDGWPHDCIVILRASPGIVVA
jgi:hypothetical protein